MAYATYITEALVCGNYDRGEAHRSLLLFTKEAGMVYAEARSVRHEHSKQRSSVQDFSYIRATLVRGKSGWRLGSVEIFDNYYYRANNRETRAGILKVLRLLRRFVRGEEPHPVLFGAVLHSLERLCVLPQTDLADELLIFEARLLGELGYIDRSQLPELTSQMAALSPATQLTLTSLIERAVAESHL